MQFEGLQNAEGGTPLTSAEDLMEDAKVRGKLWRQISEREDTRG